MTLEDSALDYLREYAELEQDADGQYWLVAMDERVEVNYEEGITPTLDMAIEDYLCDLYYAIYDRAKEDAGWGRRHDIYD